MKGYCHWCFYNLDDIDAGFCQLHQKKTDLRDTCEDFNKRL